MARLPGPLVVVVDDAHLLEGSAAGAALHSLLVDGPRHVRWVVASRWEPSQDLSGLRLAGDLHEIRADDLRFRAWEVEQLFTHWYGQPLPPEEMAELARVSEGWAAGLHLFHLATADRSPSTRRRILRSLGTRATVRDYLSRNVLDHLSPPVRAFLVRTSPLDLLTGPLCDALLERGGSLEVLRDLHASSLFTHEVGDDAWRYHDVFGSFLRALLEEELGAEEAAAWHRRAGDVLAAAGQGDAALVAYSRAQAWDPMLAHLRATGADADPRGGGWVGALPASLVADPVVALAVARAQVTPGELSRALDAYRAAEAAGLPGPLRVPARRERSAVASWVTDEAVPPAGWVALAHAAVRGDPRSASPRRAADRRRPRRARRRTARRAGGRPRAVDPPPRPGARVGRGDPHRARARGAGAEHGRDHLRARRPRTSAGAPARPTPSVWGGSRRWPGPSWSSPTPARRSTGWPRSCDGGARPATRSERPSPRSWSSSVAWCTRPVPTPVGPGPGGGGARHRDRRGRAGSTRPRTTPVRSGRPRWRHGPGPSARCSPSDGPTRRPGPRRWRPSTWPDRPTSPAPGRRLRRPGAPAADRRRRSTCGWPRTWHRAAWAACPAGSAA